MSHSCDEKYENEENSDLNALDEDILVELGEDARGEGVGGAPMDDLEVPPIDDDGSSMMMMNNHG